MPVDPQLLEGPLRFEGDCGWMYKDPPTEENPEGIVTCGRGHALFTENDAVAAFADCVEAAVRAAWRKISIAPPGLLAASYAPLTGIRLPVGRSDALLSADLERELVRLRSLCARFDVWPMPAQVACADMALNLGGYFPRKWPNFRMVVSANHPEWAVYTLSGQLIGGAAFHCHRARPISEERNAWTRDKFILAQQEQDGSIPIRISPD